MYTTNVPLQKLELKYSQIRDKLNKINDNIINLQGQKMELIEKHKVLRGKIVKLRKKLGWPTEGW